MKEVTPSDANDFLKFLEAENKELFDYVSKFNMQIIDGNIIFFKPAKMDDKLYDTYNELLDRWYSENGFK